MLDALFFALVVHADVADRAQTQLCDLRELILEPHLNLIVADNLVELLDSVATDECVNA